MMVLEHILDARIRRWSKPSPYKNSSASGKDEEPQMFVIPQLIEKGLEYQQDRSWASIDQEKAPDKVDRRILIPVLRKYGVSHNLITMVRALCRLPNMIQTCFGASSF